MPKRKMTAARILQINQWQIAGSKAKSARKKPRVIDTAQYLGKPIIPTGKNTLLYHRTNDYSADKIVKTRKWISGATNFSGIRGRSWFSIGGPVPSNAFYGKALVTVSVPRKMVRNQMPVSTKFVTVANKDLAGRKVTRHS